jgi:hypothetical protein
MFTDPETVAVRIGDRRAETTHETTAALATERCDGRTGVTR